MLFIRVYTAASTMLDTEDDDAVIRPTRSSFRSISKTSVASVPLSVPGLSMPSASSLQGPSLLINVDSALNIVADYHVGSENDPRTSHVYYVSARYPHEPFDAFLMQRRQPKAGRRGNPQPRQLAVGRGEDEGKKHYDCVFHVQLKLPISLLQETKVVIVSLWEEDSQNGDALLGETFVPLDDFFALFQRAGGGMRGSKLLGSSRRGSFYAAVDEEDALSRTSASRESSSRLFQTNAWCLETDWQDDQDVGYGQEKKKTLLTLHVVAPTVATNSGGEQQNRGTGLNEGAIRSSTGMRTSTGSGSRVSLSLRKSQHSNTLEEDQNTRAAGEYSDSVRNRSGNQYQSSLEILQRNPQQMKTRRPPFGPKPPPEAYLQPEVMEEYIPQVRHNY
ncbi:unnamed protein product [Amoebophrya sp. A25]|nr:unnamed protein product [Amoebophrya sp. A25]|eukprot:GSA25T00009122001.1